MAFKAIRNRDPSDCLDIPLPWKIVQVEEDREREHVLLVGVSTEAHPVPAFGAWVRLGRAMP